MNRQETTPAKRFPFVVCAASALVPCIAVQIAYLLAADFGQVPWCNPYIDSCTSISATGRNPPASLIFKGLMLPSAVLIALFWWLHGRWLECAGAREARIRWMRRLGWIACFGLAMYVAVLGEVGDLWRLQRKIGTILFFSFTFLSQLLLAACLLESGSHLHGSAEGVGRWMLRFCVVMLLLGVFSVIVQAISEAWHDAIEYALEWQLALLLQINFLLCARLWWDTPWRLHLARDE